MSDHGSDREGSGSSDHSSSSSERRRSSGSGGKKKHMKMKGAKAVDKEQRRGLLDRDEDEVENEEQNVDSVALGASTLSVQLNREGDLHRKGDTPSPPNTAPFTVLSGGDDEETQTASSSSSSSASVSSSIPLPHHRPSDLPIDPLRRLPSATPPPFLMHQTPTSDGGVDTAALTLDTESIPLSGWPLWRHRLISFFSPASWLYYSAHSRREMRKRPMHYCVALFSCFLVVCVAAACSTLVARAPVVFMQQAEDAAGQCDLTLRSVTSRFINYTQIKQNVEIEQQYTLNAPRITMPVKVFPAKLCGRYDAFQPDWSYIGFGNATTPHCTNTTTNCLDSLCPSSTVSKRTDVQLTAIDTIRESNMGLGRLWPLPPLQPDEAVITKSFSQEWGVKQGDTITLKITRGTRDLMQGVLARTLIHDRLSNPSRVPDGNGTSVLDAMLSTFGGHVYLPLRVIHVLGRSYGKFGSSDPRVIVESEGFIERVLRRAHPMLTHLTSFREMAELIDKEEVHEAAEHADPPTLPFPPMLYPLEASASIDISASRWATHVMFNHPDRVSIYLSTNFDTIQARIIEWSSKTIYFAGFTQLTSDLPVLNELGSTKMFSLYLGLILSIILTILFLLSLLLIYSLLTISVETFTFELGVHRMCGMPRAEIVKMLLVQSLSFSIPAWAIALVASQIGVAVVIGMLERSVEIPLDKHLTSDSIWLATTMGLCLPLLASILPIRAALGRNLQDSLDTRHSKTVGVAFNIERSVDTAISGAWMALGIGMSVLGFLIYYLVPLALLSFNLALFFNIFFALLLGMLLGLILLSLNFQPLFERFLVWSCLWWEQVAIQSLVLKSLVAHRLRNRKTSIMFALSLAFILFITSAFQIELYTAKARTFKSNGASMVVRPEWDGQTMTGNAVRQLEAILLKHQSTTVKDWGWVTSRLTNNGEWDDTVMSNLGHAYANPTDIWGVSPNLFSVSLNEYLIPSEDHPLPTSSPVSELLYTAAGSASAVMGSSASSQFGLSTTLNGFQDSFLYVLQSSAKNDEPASLQFHRLAPAAFLDSAPRFEVGRFPSQKPQPTIVSLPTFQRLSRGMYPRLEDVPLSYCLLLFHGGATPSGKDALLSDLTSFGRRHGFNVWDERSVANGLDRSNSVMTIIFSVATYIAIFLCLFSLVASMLSNLLEASKEVAVLRAVGLTRVHVVRLFSEEAFVLVMSSSLLGIGIGLIMSLTMLAQRIIFTQLPVPFFFPWQSLLYTASGSVLCAFIAATVPARGIFQAPIASIMKSMA